MNSADRQTVLRFLEGLPGTVEAEGYSIATGWTSVENAVEESHHLLLDGGTVAVYLPKRKVILTYPRTHDEILDMLPDAGYYQTAHTDNEVLWCPLACQDCALGMACAMITHQERLLLANPQHTLDQDGPLFLD